LAYLIDPSATPNIENSKAKTGTSAWHLFTILFFHCWVNRLISSFALLVSLLRSYTYPTNSLYSSRRKHREEDSFSFTYRSHNFGPLPTLLTHSAEPLFPDLQRQGKAFLLNLITSASLLSVLAFLSSFICFMPFLLSLKDSVNGISVFIFCPILLVSLLRSFP